MLKIKCIILLIHAISFEAIAYNKNERQDSIYVDVSWKTSLGTDGRIVAYPAEWKTSIGTDGRVVAYPAEWKTSIGTDRRVVAYPAEWKTSLGTDGRIVAYPNSWNINNTAIGYGKIAPDHFSIFLNSNSVGEINSHSKNNLSVNYLFYLLLNMD